MTTASVMTARAARRSALRVVAVTAIVLAFALTPVLSASLNAPRASAQDWSTTQYDTTTGDAIVNFAMQYVGYPYIWGGSGDGGFDCSGFTQYVILNVMGVDITHNTATQMGYGDWVGADALIPGDLVFFAGTYEPGISHVGIYIGGGQFVHAENESTGVVVSDLWGGYASYYAGAIRIPGADDPAPVG